MRSLLHMPLDPRSRMIRIILAEKGLPVRLVETRPWEDNEDLAAINPARTLPVLIDEPPTGGEMNLSPAVVIAEYLEEAYKAPPLMPSTSAARAEVRRVVVWFDTKFDAEVQANILREKIDRKMMRQGLADYDRLQQGADALAWHLDYIAWLLDQRHWLGCERISLADIAGAAHLSSLDYLGAVPWRDFPGVKEWYQRMKSRPSFRPLLADRVEEVAPPPAYSDLDF